MPSSVPGVKVRIGVGVTGTLVGPGGQLGDVVDALADLRFDSLWVPEVLTSPVPDPTAALAWAAARTPRLKLGTTCLLPGRNILRLAKSLATVDAVSGGRLLLTLVPGLTTEPERGAIGTPPSERGRAIDEGMPLLRRLWAGEKVTTQRPGGDLRGVVLSPQPVQQPLEPWLGGLAPPALDRCGRLGDGWLPSLCTPAVAAAGRKVIEAAADTAGRVIDPEHFGVSLAYATAPLSPAARSSISARARGADPDDLVPVGYEALRARLEAFVAVGFSKFVVRPLVPPGEWATELSALAAAVLDLQT